MNALLGDVVDGVVQDRDGKGSEIVPTLCLDLDVDGAPAVHEASIIPDVVELDGAVDLSARGCSAGGVHLKDAGQRGQAREVMEGIAVGGTRSAHGEIEAPACRVGEIEGVVPVAAGRVRVVEIIALNDRADRAGAVVRDLRAVLIDQRQFAVGQTDLAVSRPV